MTYPWLAEDLHFTAERLVCGARCAEAAQPRLYITHELTDAEIEAGYHDDEQCAGCGEVLIVDGKIQWVRLTPDQEV